MACRDCIQSFFDERERCNFRYIVVETDEAAAGVTRDELLEVLPTGTAVAPEDIGAICDVIRVAIEHDAEHHARRPRAAASAR